MCRSTGSCGGPAPRCCTCRYSGRRPVIVASKGRDIELRSSSVPSAWWPYGSEPPAELVGGSGAVYGSLERALGVPALLGIILRLSQGAGMVPAKVYRGGGENR